MDGLKMNWFNPFQAAYNAYLWNGENDFAKAIMETAEWQLEMCRVHSGSDRRCVWTWKRMQVRTAVEWRREAAEGGG